MANHKIFCYGEELHEGDEVKLLTEYRFLEDSKRYIKPVGTIATVVCLDYSFWLPIIRFEKSRRQFFIALKNIEKNKDLHENDL